MEPELGNSHIPELRDGGFCSTGYLDTLSSWLDMDEQCNPTVVDELLQDMHLLDDDFFQFGVSELGAEPTSNFPRPESGDAFVLNLSDSQPGLDNVSILLDVPTVETHDYQEYTNLVLSEENDMFQPAPTECHDNGLAVPVVVSSTVGSTTTSSTTATNSPEMTIDQLTPSANVTINMSSPAFWEDEEDDPMDQSNTMSTTMNSRNLVSERNRRKRLSQQLLALRALVPNITKMDKRSVLVDALAYLRSIHEDTACIQAELKQGARNKVQASLPPHAAHQPFNVARGNVTKPKAEILQIETEKMDECRFIVRMICKGGASVGGEVLHVIESLGLAITYIGLEQTNPHHYRTTVFVRVRKQGRMTEEKLKDCITSTALRSGLSVKDP